MKLSAKDYLASQTKMIDFEHQTLLCFSYALLYICLGFLGVLHQNGPDETVANLNFKMVENIKKSYILIIRFTFGLIYIVLGLVLRLTAEEWIFLATSFSMFSVFVEEYGRLKVKKYHRISKN
jgi:hypothetical protein